MKGDYMKYNLTQGLFHCEEYMQRRENGENKKIVDCAGIEKSLINKNAAFISFSFMAAFLYLSFVFTSPSAAASFEDGGQILIAQLDDNSYTQRFFDFYKSAKNELKEIVKCDVQKCFEEARRESILKNYDKAASIYLKIAAFDPRNADAMFAAGQNYLWNKDLKKAREWFLKTLEVSPGYIDAKLALAKTYYFNNEKKAAAKEYETLYKEHRQSNYVKLHYAQYMAWTAKYKKAAGLYGEVMTAGTDTLEAGLGLAKVYTWQKKYGAAIDVLTALLKEYKDGDESFDIRLELARLYTFSGRLRSSLKLYSELSSLNKNDGRVISGMKELSAAYLSRGIEAYHEKNYERAAELLNYTIAKFPSVREAYKYSGLIYASSSSYEAAIKRFDKYLKYNKNDYEIFIAAAQCHQRLASKAAAEKYYMKAADAMKRSGIDEAAIKELIAAGRAYKTPEEEEKALKAQAALKSERDALAAKRSAQYESLMGLARKNSQSRDYDAAIINYREALALKPGSYDARLYIALNLSWQKKYLQAIEEYKKMLIDYPLDSEITGSIARTYFWMGKFYKSLNYYREAYSRNKKSLETITGYANALHIFSLDRQASEKIEEALAKDADYPYAKSLKRAIAEAHRTEFKPFRQNSKDSDLINANSFGGDIATDIDLNTRLKASYRNYDIFMDNSPLKYKAETANLKVQTQISPLIKVFGGVSIYGFSDPRGGRDHNTGYLLGAGYNKVRHLSMSLYFDKSIIFENPAAFRNKISMSGPVFELKRSMGNDYEMLLGAGYHVFSDSNTKKNMSFKFNKTMKKGDFKLIAGPLYKYSAFKEKRYNGYYSPVRHDSGGLEYHLSYMPPAKNYGLTVNEEYGRSKEFEKLWKNYHKYTLEGFYNIRRGLELRASYLKTDSGADSAAAEDGEGYWYERFGVNLNYKW